MVLASLLITLSIWTMRDLLRATNGENPIYVGMLFDTFSPILCQTGDCFFFTLSCWLDIQVPYTTVWTTYLQQANNCISGGGKISRGNYPHTAPHLQLTMETVRSYGSISEWFIQTINDIVQKYGQSSGNLYRFAGEVCSDLYNLRRPRLINVLRRGQLPTNFSGGDHKRFWMFVMFLRRDNSVVRCLLTRALNHYPGGQQATQYWYDPTCFDPNECELSVDSRVFNNWNDLLRRTRIQNFNARSPRQVAEQARVLAQHHSISPSVFDAILFF